MNYNPSKSMASSRGDVGEKEKERSTTLPTQLRPLPGYSNPLSPAPAPSLPTTATPAPFQKVVPPTTGRYQTRERLYYETDVSLPTNSSVRPTSVVARLADDAPPAVSLHEFGSLTPERKYAPPPEEEPRGDQSLLPTAEPMMPSEGNWVTIFGFSGAQASSVQAYFQKVGVVEQSEVGQGNWMHLQYTTRWAAQKALAKNGTVLSVAGSCMIGVVPTARAMDQVGQAAESFMSPLKKETIKRPNQDQNDSIFIKPGMGPLQQTEPPEEVKQIYPRNMNVPEESMVSKALGFVFGW